MQRTGRVNAATRKWAGCFWACVKASRRLPWRRCPPRAIAMPVKPTCGLPVRPVWPEIEAYAERLERLARQQSRVKFEIAQGHAGPALNVFMELAEPGHAVRVAIEGKEVRYYYEADGEAFQADLPDASPDQ